MLMNGKKSTIKKTSERLMISSLTKTQILMNLSFAHFQMPQEKVLKNSYSNQQENNLDAYPSQSSIHFACYLRRHA